MSNAGTDIGFPKYNLDQIKKYVCLLSHAEKN